MRGISAVTAPLILLCLTALTTSGCATRSESVDVTVRNDAAQPVIVWLTKVGGPEEEGWRSPESVAINFVVDEEPLGGVLVPPQKTARTGKRKGKFDEGAYPVLRVYRGEMKLSEILASGKDSPNRADVVLDPGVNRLVVMEANGKIAVKRADQTPQTSQ